jgi:hypothetical protein
VLIRPVGCNVGASPCGQQNEAWHGFGCWLSDRVKDEIISNFKVECRFIFAWLACNANYNMGVMGIAEATKCKVLQRCSRLST